MLIDPQPLIYDVEEKKQRREDQKDKDREAVVEEQIEELCRRIGVPKRVFQGESYARG